MTLEETLSKALTPEMAEAIRVQFLGDNTRLDFGIQAFAEFEKGEITNSAVIVSRVLEAFGDLHVYSMHMLWRSLQKAMEHPTLRRKYRKELMEILCRLSEEEADWDELKRSLDKD